jgi:hypothetical protein
VVEVQSGVDRFLSDQYRVVNLDEHYLPYPKQAEFHASTARHRFIGGAAGPGKTTCGIFDHLVSCNEFGVDDAKHVHTLLLRRTYPKLESTLITRFREVVPRELYLKYAESPKHEVTWLNGATSRFGSMQYESDAYGWQGQWFKIFYDELCEFTFNQWVATSAWNRCPVSPWSTKDGAGNPIGIGAGWVENVFVLNKPADEMDEAQKAQYSPADYAYFPCTYLENPIYANDPVFLANLNSYPAEIREALKLGKWGLAGGYFQGAWDEAYNVYNPESEQIAPWHHKWLGGDWGFEHDAAIYWFYMDDSGIVRIYRELVVKHQPPEMLAETIITNSYGSDGKIEKYDGGFFFSHDAFASRATATTGSNANSIAFRMGPVLRKAGLPAPSPSTRDKLGREQLMYEMLRQRVKVGEVYDDDAGKTIDIERAKLQIANTCQKLIRLIPRAPRDEKNREEIATFLGDDPLQGAGYGLYGKFGKPKAAPAAHQIAQALKGITDPSEKHLTHLKLEAKWKKNQRPITRSNDWRNKLSE